MNRKTYTAFLLFVLTCCYSVTVEAQKKKKEPQAQKVTVEARLVDQDGNPIPNALITLGEGLLQTHSDADGKFSIRAETDDALLITATGHESHWIRLTEGLPQTEIVLHKHLLFTSEAHTYHLPLGIESNRRSMTGAVSRISGQALESYPDLTLSNALQGRIMGLTARQTADGLGNNDAALYIRGLARGGSDGIITVVDGIERPIGYLIAEEIESIEVLKDATAKILYGPRAANGVLLVTTKRGKPNTKVLKASVDYGTAFVTRMPQYLNSFEYASLYNEARANDGLTPFYTEEDLQGYKNSAGVNDQRYPEVDYYDYFLNTSAPYRKATLEYSGGDEINQYSLIAGYSGGDGLEKVGTTPTLDKFNLRANLDIKINRVLSGRVGASGLVETRKWGNINHAQAFSALSSHRPNEYPFVIDDPMLESTTAEGDDTGVPPLGGSFHRPANVYGTFMYGGFSEFQAFYGQTNVGLDFNLNDVTEGLRANAYYTIDNYQFFQNGKTEVPVSYAQRWFKTANGSDTVQYYQLRKRTIEDNQRRQNQNFFNNSGWTATLAYDRVFGRHDLSLNATHFFYKKDDDDWIQDLQFTNTTFRLKYGLNDKIYAEATMAYMGSDKMPVKNRHQFFPAAGAAWVISEEGFLNGSESVNFLKLKGSFGILGYDRSTDYYLFENRWNTNGTVWFDEQNKSAHTRTQLQLTGNPDLDWEKSREINAGIEGLALNNRLLFEFNYFNTYRYDIIQSPAYSYSVTAGDLYPQVNQGETLNRGVEGQLSWTNTTGGLTYTVGGNFVYSKNEVVRMNEVIYPQALQYTRQTGQPSDAMFGYTSSGLFLDQAQVESHPFQTLGAYGVGNIAYEDLNGDGVVDQLDTSPIGNSFPRTTLGVHVDLHYKGFGLFILGTSELGVDQFLSNSYYWNRAEGKYSVEATDRFHPVANPQGHYPMLTTTTGSNDYRNSTFWIQDASFFRLKNVELSYTFPSSAVAKSYRFYVRGSNLLVMSKNKDLDPEALNAGVTNYPVLRTIAAGLSVSF